MRRLEGAAAIAFALMYVVALVLTDVPDEGESRRQAADFYNSAGDKARLLVAVALMAVAALLFGLFAAASVDRLRGVARHLAGIAAGGFVALYLAAAAAFLAPTFTLSLDPDGANAVDRRFVDFARGMSTLGDTFLLVFSLVAAAGFVGALAWSGGLPRWLAWSGWVVAATCLLGVLFFPLFLFALWTLALGVWSVRRPAHA
jgi:MFS family permease